MKCKVCGQRHKSREEAAAAHAPRVAPAVVVQDNNTALPPPEEVVEVVVQDNTNNRIDDEPAKFLKNPRSKAEQKNEPLLKKKKVKYRGRYYTGTVTDEGVEIILKSGEKRIV